MLKKSFVLVIKFSCSLLRKIVFLFGRIYEGMPMKLVHAIQIMYKGTGNTGNFVPV